MAPIKGLSEGQALRAVEEICHSLSVEGMPVPEDERAVLAEIMLGRIDPEQVIAQYKAEAYEEGLSYA